MLDEIIMVGKQQNVLPFKPVLDFFVALAHNFACRVLALSKHDLEGLDGQRVVIPVNFKLFRPLETLQTIYKFVN